MKSSHSTVGALTGIARQQISSNISSLISIRGWCEGFGEDWMSKSPLPHCCHPPSQGQCSRWLIIVLTLPSERSGPSASLPPQNTLLTGPREGTSTPRAGETVKNDTNRTTKINIWSGQGGTIDSFLMISMSPALPASPGHWKPKSLLDQGWPGFDSATSVPHKKFTCGLSGQCRPLEWQQEPAGTRATG